MRPRHLPDPQPRGSRGVQRPGEHHLDDLAPLLKRLAPVLDNLGHLTATRLGLWLAAPDGWRAASAAPGTAPPWPPVEGVVPLGPAPARLVRLLEEPGVWLTVAGSPAPVPAEHAEGLAVVVGRLVDGAREVGAMGEELRRRVEEIDLLYGISGVFARTVTLEEAAAIIVREVSSVVGARRASIMVHDEATGTLRAVAARGFEVGGLPPVPVDDPASVAARVYRLQVPLIGTPPGAGGGGRPQASGAYLSVPICHQPPGGTRSCVGVINLTDREGDGRFGPEHRRLVEAIASQIGVAIEQARLVALDRAQQRIQHELTLARDLQRKLLPPLETLDGDAEVAVLFDPVDSVGGDFYTFSRLGLGCVGVMLGDVSSHGLSAALVMAVVLATAGIHAPASVTPDETLTAMGQSLAQKLSSTESYLTVFHGVLDPVHRRLTYASAGHPHAFRVPLRGDPVRLETTAPPLGLGGVTAVASRQVDWVPGEDLLCLWTDGLVDARSADGDAYGEERLLAQLVAARTARPEEVMQRVLADADRFAGQPADDRTLLILRL